MGYQVLYRKYRPRDFSEVIGQEHVVKVISNAIRQGRVAHAFLFSGPRGIGKTTIARLIAKAVNCVNASDTVRHPERSEGSPAALNGAIRSIPCNACPSCEIFNRGQALNLIEIDAASNRGIDEIRELRDAVRFAPAEGRYKVYIIDECHQLTKDAANALLKTLEEPPAHAIFILATTELDKVPATIVSRTQAFDFRRPRRELIASRLIHIAKSEGINLEPEAADLIAFAAEGSIRDAESMLGKIIAVEDEHVSAEEVEEILGIPQHQAVEELGRLISAKDLTTAIAMVDRMYQQGYEMEYITKMLISFFRGALLEAMSAPLGNGVSKGSAALGLSAGDLAKVLNRLLEALTSFRASPMPQLPLELALVDIIHGIGNK